MEPTGKRRRPASGDGAFQVMAIDVQTDAALPAGSADMSSDDFYPPCVS